MRTLGLAAPDEHQGGAVGPEGGKQSPDAPPNPTSLRHRQAPSIKSVFRLFRNTKFCLPRPAIKCTLGTQALVLAQELP